jgi:replicative DNA helicase
MADIKLPPHDSDAEEAVLGSLLIDGPAIYKVAGFLLPEDFFVEQNGWVYATCVKLYSRNEAVNQITVARELDREGKLAACGGAAHISQLIANCATPLDIEHYGRIVYRLAISRRMIDAAQKIEKIGFDANPDVDESLNKAEDVLFKLRHGQSPRDFAHIRQVLDKYFEPQTPEAEPGQPEQLKQVDTTYAGLDEFLGGLQRSDLIIVAGRPSMGKTSFALSIAQNAAVKRGACVAVFSLEMAREALVLRMLAAEADVDSRRVHHGQSHSEDEERRIMHAIGVLSEAQIYIDDSPGVKIVEMRSKARRLHFEHGIDLIIVDYLQLMAGDTRTENRVQEIGYISRSLKGLARELNVPVVVVSQLSRQVEWRSSHKPQLSDLRESGSIEQDADIVMFIYRDDYYFNEKDWQEQHPDEPYPAGIADIIIAKHRNGPTGEVKLHFIAKSAKFKDMSNQESSLL